MNGKRLKNYRNLPEAYRTMWETKVVSEKKFSLLKNTYWGDWFIPSPYGTQKNFIIELKRVLITIILNLFSWNHES